MEEHLFQDSSKPILIAEKAKQIPQTFFPNQNLERFLLESNLIFDWSIVQHERVSAAG